MRLVLDVDGVLLIAGPAPAPFAREYLEFAVERFDCTWLTTRCRGDAEPVVTY